MADQLWFMTGIRKEEDGMSMMSCPSVRLSVCLSVRLSVCRLWSVTLLHPTQRLELFGNIFAPSIA